MRSRDPLKFQEKPIWPLPGIPEYEKCAPTPMSYTTASKLVNPTPRQRQDSDKVHVRDSLSPPF